MYSLHRSFIGYSGSFPKLIVDLFGYLPVKEDGCATGGDFVIGGDQATCVDGGGTWYVVGEGKQNLIPRIGREPPSHLGQTLPVCKTMPPLSMT